MPVLTLMCGSQAGRDAYAPDIVLFNEAVRNTQDPSSFTYKNKEVKDVSSAKLSNLFTETTGFIRQGAKAGGVLVHCMMGVSRSSSCVIAYLIDTKGMTFDDAFALVKSRRVAAIPNAGFTKQLREHARLRAERMAKGGGSGKSSPMAGLAPNTPGRSSNASDKQSALSFLADAQNYQTAGRV